MGSSAAIIRNMLQLHEFAETGADMKDEEYDEHCFRPRASAAKDEDDPIWCADCEYHRDHKIHAGSPSPMREQTPEQFSPAVVLQAAREECHRLRVDNDALSARCTALTDINAGLVKDHNYLLIDGAKWQTRAETAEARCTALEQERDQLQANHWRNNEALAEVMRRDATTIADLRSRCQHLEQAVKDLINGAVSTRSIADDRYDGAKRFGHNPSWVKVSGLQAALASLLPTQEETPGTDENRVSFAAGYTAALDDALKGKP